MALRYFLCVLTGYLLGSLNFGIIVSRLLYKKDVRNYGSKNAGMTNTARTFGKNGRFYQTDCSLPCCNVFAQRRQKYYGLRIYSRACNGNRACFPRLFRL